MTTAPYSIPILLRNNKGMDTCIISYMMTIHCNILISHIAIQILLGIKDVNKGISTVLMLKWALFDFCKINEELLFFLFHDISYLCLLVRLNCQFPGYDNELLAAIPKYIWRFGLRNCDIYVSHNECVLKP